MRATLGGGDARARAHARSAELRAARAAGLIVDIAQDVIALNKMAMGARRSGMLICGGGLVKHHICNANLMRNGANYAVFVNTGQEFDGSDSGARPDEAVSWGKVRPDCQAVKVYAEATIILPLLVSQTFAQEEGARAAVAKAKEAAAEGAQGASAK